MITKGFGLGLLSLAICTAFGMGACSSDESTVAGPSGLGGGGHGATDGAAGSGGGIVIDGSTDAPNGLTITPNNPVVTYDTSQPAPTVQFQVLANGTPASALWAIDRAEIGSIDGGGLFTAAGKAAGTATVEATVGTAKLKTQVTVEIKATQNGGTPTTGNIKAGGGPGGVGGEGEGGGVDSTLVGVLDGAPQSDPALAFLYPYPDTVWPLGVLPPLLMWKGSGTTDGADAVKIELSTTGYSYTGYFGRPPPLGAGAPFVRHPIPKSAWEQATLSAAGGTLTLKVTVAAGGTAYGPITMPWKVATGRLKGTVYYQSYGTNLAKNYSGAKGGDGTFGGATLAIKPGATDPVLVAGTTGGHDACRVCHTVNGGGSRMVVQHGDKYNRSSSYDLINGYAETPYAASTDGNLGFIGMTEDGALGLSNATPIPGGANGNSTGLFDMATGAAVTANGLSGFVARAGMPAFSPDDKLVAFNLHAGPGSASTGAGDGTQLVVMDFARATTTFSNGRLLHQSAQRPGWPTFLPTSAGVVFQKEIQTNASGEYFATRYGAKGELWWVDVATATATRLDNANGKGHAPVGPGNHADATVLNYEPTVGPVPSGGYAWVVFMSRRLYGNVATIDPWASDPREHDLVQNITTKKLWVAAIDLNAKPGTDPSHPAFYVPAQELLAGNARGYWVLDPCKADGSECSSGDECCGGFCQLDPKTNQLTCGKKNNECSQEFDKCTVNADCCDPSLQCINERCAQVTPR